MDFENAGTSLPYAFSESDKLVDIDDFRYELIEKNTEYQARLSYLHSEIKAVNDDIIRMNGEISQTESDVDKFRGTIEENQQSITTLFDQISSITKIFEENSGIKVLRDELIDLKEKKSRLSNQITQDDLRRQVLASDLTKLSEKRHNEEIAISKVDSELEYMQNRVQDEYNLTYETCQHLRDSEYNIAISSQTITELKRKISALGPVNPGAIEEFELLKVRYDGLMVQREDLEKAEKDINLDSEEKAVTFSLVGFSIALIIARRFLSRILSITS